MVISIITKKNKKEILVKSYKIINKKIIINGDYIIKRMDYIKYECKKCKNITKEKFKSKGNFLDELYICSNCKRKLTCISKYGTDSINKVTAIKNKKKEVCLERYGVEHPMFLEKTKNKMKSTCLEKYGVEYASSSEEFRKNVEETCLKKYGVKNIAKLKTIKNIFVKTGRINFYNELTKRVKNSKPMFTKEEYVGSKKKYKWKCKKCNNVFYDSLENGKEPTCNICFPKYRSKYEIEINNFLLQNNIKTEINKKIIFPYDVDIYILSKNLAIEFNGLYWHNSLFKNKTYHIEKTNRLRAKGIRTIHIFEDEWLHKKDIVKSILLNLVGQHKKRYGAREATVSLIKPKIKNLFLNNNHLQGEDKSEVNLGAYIGNNLIGVMTFSKPRIALGAKKNKSYYELSRFCIKRNYSVVGLFSKMLKFFINLKLTDKIITFADLRWSNGDVYLKNGFTFIKQTKPNYWYFKTREIKRKHRFSFRKDKLVREGFDKNKTEKQIMEEMGYLRIYDCGSLRFELIL